MKGQQVLIPALCLCLWLCLLSFPFSPLDTNSLQYVEREKMSEEAKKERQKRIQAIKKQVDLGDVHVCFLSFRSQERALDWGADEGIDDGRGLRIVILKVICSAPAFSTPPPLSEYDTYTALLLVWLCSFTFHHLLSLLLSHDHLK